MTKNNKLLEFTDELLLIQDTVKELKQSLEMLQ